MHHLSNHHNNRVNLVNNNGNNRNKGLVSLPQDKGSNKHLNSLNKGSNKRLNSLNKLGNHKSNSNLNNQNSQLLNLVKNKRFLLILQG